MNKENNINDYISFEPSVKPAYEEDSDDFWYLFKNNKIMMLNKDNKLALPRSKYVDDLNINLCNTQHMGAYCEYNCYCGEIEEDIEIQNVEFLDLKDLSKSVDKSICSLVFKAKLLLGWLKLNQYCGICGSPTYKKDSDTERALVCSKCGNTTWPRTSPAIIVAITKEDKLLLAHNRHFPNGEYSCIAGFVEYGETFEECVKREVYEEVGIRVKNIKYFGSQPWPFPNSMMIGFTAEYLEGEIEEDGEEIIHAKWFEKDEVKDLYKHRNSISINDKLTKCFLKTH